MDKFIIKTIVVLSLILGAILGLLAPIPFVGMVMLFAALLLAAPLVVIYLIMDGKFDLTTIKDSIITGALIGFVSSIAFSTLLNEGIGDTIRVSLSSSPENEVVAGINILKECGKRSGGVKLVSCPRCGRIGFDVHAFVDRWQNRLLAMNKDVTVAVMGCVVNGPGEGRHADLGIAGTNDKAIIFKKGKIVRTIDAKDADKVFEEELKTL